MSVTIKKVGRKIPGTKKEFPYSQVEFDSEGWADPHKYIPADFDLVLVEAKDIERLIPAWSVGRKWEGARITGNEEIFRWKRRMFTDE